MTIALTQVDLFGFATKPETNQGPQYDILPVSVVDVERSIKKRRIGQNDFSGKSSRTIYSEFSPEAARLAYQHWLRDCKMIADPFAGWGERHYYAQKYGLNYAGFDLNPEAIDYARDEYGVENTLADSNAVNIRFDGMLTCPPYWNLELYSKDARGGDRKESWEAFKSWYFDIFARWYAMAERGAWFVVVVGNWRKGGVYYDLDYWTRHAFLSYGAEMMDSVILSRKKISKIKIMLPQAKRCKYSVNVHEVMNVFQKPY